MKICHVPEQKWPEEYAENQHQVKPTIVFGEESVTSARINLFTIEKNFVCPQKYST
jgi:hypothetical protein